MDAVDGVSAGVNDQDAVPPGTRAGARRHRSRRAIVLSTAVAATAAIGAAFGLAGSGAATAAATATSTSSASIDTALGQNRYGYGYGSGGYGYGGSGSSGSDSSSGTSTLASATAAQEVGVVDIISELTYDQAESAGTGLVLTSSGEILTNNHVVEGATSISVTVVATGAQYTATVVGTDATDDVAVLQLSNASGLGTADLDTASDATVGVGWKGSASLSRVMALVRSVSRASPPASASSAAACETLGTSDSEEPRTVAVKVGC